MLSKIEILCHSGLVESSVVFQNVVKEIFGVLIGGVAVYDYYGDSGYLDGQQQRQKCEKLK